MLAAEFIEGSRGNILCTYRSPADSAPRHAVLVLPAFGDEMNKSRRMVTETAMGLERRGVAVLIPDLFGTGDSEGEFVDASWGAWIDDLASVIEWARAKTWDVRAMLAVRTGALLVAPVILASRLYPEVIVLWQPVSEGRRFLKQLLRTRVMAMAISKGKRESVDELLERVLSGDPLVVGGYELTGSIAKSLIAAELNLSMMHGSPEVSIFETVRSSELTETASVSLGGVECTRHRLLGEPYWTATETIRNGQLIASTIAALSRSDDGCPKL